MKIESSEFGDRRNRLAGLMAPNSVAVVLSAETQYRNHDTEHKFRQASSFWYLTGFGEPNSALIIRKEASGEFKSIIFVPRKDPAEEVWTGLRMGVEVAKDALGMDQAFPWGELLDRLPRFLRGIDQLYFDYAARPHQTLARQVMEICGRLRINRITSSQNLIGELRLFKSPAEIELMKEAARINVGAHLEALKSVRAGKYEYQIEALIEGYYRDHGMQWAYPSIVAGGKNATILHYTANQEVLKDGDLLLIDAGCECEYYASDITRTFPVNGRFSASQAEIHAVVQTAHQKALECASNRNDGRFDDIHQAALKALVRGLIDLQIIRAGEEEALEKKLYQKYYMHRTGHWLGLDVHDLGSYQEEDGRSRLLKPGMVMTVEPGLYFNPSDETVPTAYRGIGIRIEDNILIGQKGVEILTADLPKDASLLGGFERL